MTTEPLDTPTVFDNAYLEREDERELSLAAFDRLTSEHSDG